MATHSSVLAWEIPWTEEPGGVQSMGLQELDMTGIYTHTLRFELYSWVEGLIFTEMKTRKGASLED